MYGVQKMRVDLGLFVFSLASYVRNLVKYACGNIKNFKTTSICYFYLYVKACLKSKMILNMPILQKKVSVFLVLNRFYVRTRDYINFWFAWVIRSFCLRGCAYAWLWAGSCSRTGLYDLAWALRAWFKRHCPLGGVDENCGGWACRNYHRLRRRAALRPPYFFSRNSLIFGRSSVAIWRPWS